MRCTSVNATSQQKTEFMVQTRETYVMAVLTGIFRGLGPLSASTLQLRPSFLGGGLNMCMEGQLSVNKYLCLPSHSSLLLTRLSLPLR